MPLDWLDTPVSELIARGRRSRAIEALRHRLSGRLAPSTEIRLQLVDLLTEAGRGVEAVPILLGLADEFAKDSFVAKAVAVLKRVEGIEPGRADVESRLARLVKQQQEPQLGPEIGLQAFAASPAAETPPEPQAETPPEPPAEGPPEPQAEAAPEATAPSVPEPVLDTPPVEDLPPAEALPPEVEPAPGFRGAVRRFVASLGLGAGVEPQPAVPEAEDLPTIEPEPEPAAEPAETAPAEGRPDASLVPGLSEEAFRQELLDIADEIVHKTPEPAPALPPPDRARLVLYAERLLASALFKDLAEEDLLAVVHDLRLATFDSGEVVVSEGEKSEGLFIVATGAVKVFVRSPTGRNVAVARLSEGQFFGEIASLSGRPRSATVTTAARTELLTLDGPALQALTTRHPSVGRVLEDSYVERASSEDVAAVRAVRLADQELRRRADEVLEAHFGQSRWDPRMKLRLADLLLRTDKEDDAVAVLVGLADDFAREGFPEKAIAVLKKIERTRRRHLAEVSLAPLHDETDEAEEAPPRPPPLPADPGPPRPPQATGDFLQRWLVDVLRERVHQVATAAPVRGYGPGLRASPLLTGLTEDELLALIRGLRLIGAGAGDILVSEGEPGESVFILAAGFVRVFVNGADGRCLPIGALGEGAFFGEIAALSGRPRSATVVAMSACELLELDRPSLDRIVEKHPRVRHVLEAVGAARTEARARLSERE